MNIYSPPALTIILFLSTVNVISNVKVVVGGGEGGGGSQRTERYGAFDPYLHPRPPTLPGPGAHDYQII